MAISTKKMNYKIIEKVASLASEIAGKQDPATTLAGYGITDAYTKSEVYGKTETYDKTEVDALPTIHASTTDPTAADGKNGDIWVKYTV